MSEEMTIVRKMELMRDAVTIALFDTIKFEEMGNKAASRRVTKRLQLISNACKEIRADIFAKREEM